MKSGWNGGGWRHGWRPTSGMDLRLGVRLVAKSPGLSAAAILTLAVAIAGNTAIFSVANSLLLKPVPVAAPQELVRIRAGQSQMSWVNQQDLRERTNVFAALVAHRRLRIGWRSASGLPVRLEGEQTSSNFFDALRVPPVRGRTYDSNEPRRDVAVLAYDTWRVRFGADPAIAGRIVTLNGNPYEVIGVMPAGFRGVAPAGFLTDVWFPVADDLRAGMPGDRALNRFEVFGRLKPGVTRTQAAAALSTAARQIRADHPELPDTFANVEVFPVDGLGAFRGMGNFVQFDVMLDGAATGTQRVRVMANRLTPGWFATVRIPLLAGRDFTWDDRAGAPDVAIVNDTFARRFWNGNAVGQRLRAFQRDVQIVGIVRDSKYWTLGETTEPTLYLPFQQHYFRHVAFHVRSANWTAATALITGELRRLAPGVSADFSPMTDVLATAVFPARVGAAVTGALGVLAMLLAALGVYGLVAFSVAGRSAEIGIRKAVGARTIDLVLLIVSEHLSLAVIGLGVGLGLGTLGATLLRSFITEVSPVDPLTLIGTATLVMAVALAACTSPALRAVRVNPLAVLRDA